MLASAYSTAQQIEQGNFCEACNCTASQLVYESNCFYTVELINFRDTAKNI